MAFASTLKQQYDLPVFEWLRVAPVATAALSGLVASQRAGPNSCRYMYYNANTSMYRYDTWTDGWSQLANLMIGLSTVSAMEYLPNWGYQGFVIAKGSTSSKTHIPGLTGNTLVGYEIEIIDGCGKGQVRTITAITEPKVHEFGYMNGGSILYIGDSVGGAICKVWKTNMWRNYQVRIVNGMGAGQVRRILYSTPTNLQVADSNWSVQEAGYYGPFATTPGTGSLYQIESSEITVNTPWTTEPDETSRFNVRSGAILVLSSGATPWQSWQYYDCAADVWYQKSVGLNMWGMTSAMGTDCSITAQYPMTDANGVANGTCTAGAANGSYADYTMLDSGASWVTGSLRNLVVTVTETATGRTQDRRILANIGTKLWVTEKWETPPTTSYTYTIHPAHDKAWAIGGAVSSLFRYDIDEDVWLLSQVYEYGVARGISCQRREHSRKVGRAFGIASGTRATGSVLTAAVGAAGTGYRAYDLLTVSVGTACKVRVLTVTTAGGIATVALEECGSGYTTGTVATTGGSGTSGTIAITVGSVATIAAALTVNLKVGDTISVAGDTSAGGYYNVTDATVLGVLSNANIQYEVNASCAASAVLTAQSTSVLYDAAKSWTAGEHVGKYLVVYAITGAGMGMATQCRKITANAAGSITVGSNITAAVNGSSRYAIVDQRVFGTDDTWKGDDSRGGLIGVATGIDGGATAKTSLRDSTKSWVTNVWKDGGARKIRILTGPLMGLEIACAGNSADTLYWSAQASEVDANTVYCIRDNYGEASTTGSTTALNDASQNWQTNQHAGKRLKCLACFTTDAANHGLEVAVSANTATGLTVGAMTSTVAGTGYAILTVPMFGSGMSLDWIAHRSTGDGVTLDKSKCGRYLMLLRGGNTNQFWRYDICRGIWEMINPTPQGVAFTTGSCLAYDHMDRCYIMSDSVAGRIFYLDLKTNRIEQAGQLAVGFGAAILGERARVIETADGLKYLYFMRPTDTLFLRMLCAPF